MLIEYLEDIEDPLLRLFKFTESEALQLAKAIKTRLLTKNSGLNLEELNFVKKVNCSLIMKLHNKDLGLIRIKNDMFHCLMTQDSYQQMTDLIKPFARKDSGSYQWLDCLATYDGDYIPKTEFLFSVSGGW